MTGQSALRLIKAEHKVHSQGSPAPRAQLSEIELTIKEYLLARRQEQRAAGTLEKYAFRLDQLAGWLTERGATELSDLSRLLLREWGASLNPDWSPATMRHAVTIVRGWLNWCAAEGLIESGLATALRVPKVRLRTQRTLSGDEVHKLLDACDGSAAGLRDAAIVSLMVDSGLRASEVCRVKAGDLVFNFPLSKRKVNFIPALGKGGDEEPVYFGEATSLRLQAWLKARDPAPGVESLFISLGGNTPRHSLTRNGLGNLLQKLGQRAGVPDVSPHSLRRAFAVLLEDSGHTTRQIQALGRWSDIRMVERYTLGMRVARNYHAPMDSLEK